MTPHTMLTYACVATGSMQGQANASIDRLYRMLLRFSPRHPRLICVTDQARTIHPDIVQIDASAWPEFKKPGTHPTYYKLSLFNSQYVPYPDFIYLDLSVIIQGPLQPIVAFAEQCSDDLVIVRGWSQSEVNSSVMRIRNAQLGFIHGDFESGIRYPEHVPGDQDFIAGAMHAHHRSFAAFPSSHIVSFKQVMRQGIKDWDTVHKIASNASIVKFHGAPKPHTIFETGYLTLRYGPRYWLKGHFHYPFDTTRLRDCWDTSA